MATRRSQLRHATEPAPPQIGAGSDSNPSRLRRQSEPAPSSIRACSDSNPSWLRPLPFPRGIKSPSLRPSKRIHLPLTLAAAALARQVPDAANSLPNHSICQELDQSAARHYRQVRLLCELPSDQQNNRPAEPSGLTHKSPSPCRAARPLK